MEIFQHINWVDILVVIIVVRITYVSFKEGLSHQIFPLIGSIVVLVLPLHYYRAIGALASSDIGIPRALADFLAFLAIAVAFGFVAKLIKFLLDKIIKIEWHPVIERFGGIIAGVVRAFITASIILILLCVIPLPYFQRSIKTKSLTGLHILKLGAVIYESTAKALPVIRVSGSMVKSGEVLNNLTEEKSVEGLPKKSK